MSFTVSKTKIRGATMWRVRSTQAGERKAYGTFRTRDEAARHAKALAAEAGPRSSRGTTLGLYFARWAETRELSGFYKDTRGPRMSFALYIEQHPIAAMELKAIRPKHVSQWIESVSKRRGVRTGRPLARQTMQNALNALRRCLRDAVRDGWIDTNPARDAAIPRKVGAHSWTHLTPGEIATVTTPRRGEPKYWTRARLAYTVAIYTGLRAGELWGLRWERVKLDADPPCVEVRQSYGGTTKSNRAIRDVPLLPPAAAALEALRTLGGVTRARGYVFPTHLGGAHVPGFDFQWREFREGADFGRLVRFHDLRHTCAVHLVSGTWGRAWRLEEVRDWLGHSSVTVTERYARFRPDSIRAAGREANAAFGGQQTGNTKNDHTRK